MEFSAPLYLKIFVFPIQAPDGEVVPLSFEHVAQNVAQDVSRKDYLAAQRRGDVEGGGGWELAASVFVKSTTVHASLPSMIA